METLERTDEETIDRLDFEPAIACAVESAVCVEKAVALIICRSCRISSPTCAPCVALVRVQIAGALAAHGDSLAVMCTACHCTSSSFDGLWSVVPLKGGWS
jgi:hypothetical protein